MTVYTTTYSDTRQNLKSWFDKACSEHSFILMKRASGENVVILSADDFSSLQETAYLLRSPVNAKRLLMAKSRAQKKQN